MLSGGAAEGEGSSERGKEQSPLNQPSGAELPLNPLEIAELPLNQPSGAELPLNKLSGAEHPLTQPSGSELSLNQPSGIDPLIAESRALLAAWRSWEEKPRRQQ